MLGEKLLMLRKKFGYSQQELADKLSVTRQTISNWECGQGAPTLDKAMELATIYNLSLDEWIRIEYTRTKENHLLKKETVVKLIDINAVNGFEIMEDDV